MQELGLAPKREPISRYLEEGTVNTGVISSPVIHHHSPVRPINYTASGLQNAPKNQLTLMKGRKIALLNGYCK